MWLSVTQARSTGVTLARAQAVSIVSLRRPGLNPRLVRVGFEVDRVALGGSSTSIDSCQIVPSVFPALLTDLSPTLCNVVSCLRDC